MNENIQELGFFDIIEARRSVRIFDQESPFNHQVVQKCLDAATLAPNSSNLQLWEFYRIPETSPSKPGLDKLCMKQKAATTARELVVVVTRRDKWKSRAKANYGYIQETYKNSPGKKQKQALSYYGKLIPKLYSKFPLWSLIKQLVAWFIGLRRPMVREVSETDIRISVHKSAALAAMTFMYAMKAEGYDTCPMEGMDSLRVKKLLNLPNGAEISMIIGCGKGLPEGIYGKRFRVPNEEVIFGK
ncbi:Nitroreductase [Aquiflexum balticum DSM 16537]|uniref:Nitroreductase n=1 Tax=Aquiflexum balticum DSM 16537 TaxID=758820 RepID=A0A1W2H4J2_9BACT|nr:nitroreductase family protein [Aquiflexum balticum]SMD43532.1 Nitroreductase [Aquiflexum balticum DSM 16537]